MRGLMSTKHAVRGLEGRISYSSIRPYVCNTCGNGFGVKSNLRHTNEKKHVCNTCGEGFWFKRRVTAHQITHTGVKRHVCSECDKKRNYAIIRHQLLHKWGHVCKTRDAIWLWVILVHLFWESNYIFERTIINFERKSTLRDLYFALKPPTSLAFELRLALGLSRTTSDCATKLTLQRVYRSTLWLAVPPPVKFRWQIISLPGIFR